MGDEGKLYAWVFVSRVSQTWAFGAVVLKSWIVLDHLPLAGAKWIVSKMVEDQQQDIPEDWLEAFQAAAQRPLATRINYAFIRTHKPVLDDVSYRAFDTMAAYRHWCETNLPDWLGYGRI